MPAVAALPAAFGRPGEGEERPGRAVLGDFLAKVLRLAALRLADLCDRLDFEPLDRQDVLTQARRAGRGTPVHLLCLGSLAIFQCLARPPCF